MVLKDILAISGQPGLFRFIAQGKNAIIVEQLETGKRSSVFTSSKVSSLEDITVFTDNEDLSLGTIFDRIYDREEGSQAPDAVKDTILLKKYFEEVVPEYSRERVYTSHMRKIIHWYNILQKLNMLIRDVPEIPSDKEKHEEISDQDNTSPAVEEKKSGVKTKKRKEASAGPSGTK